MQRLRTFCCLIIVTTLALGGCRPREAAPVPATDGAPTTTAPSATADPPAASVTVEPPIIIEEAPTPADAPSAPATGKNLELIAPTSSVSTNPFQVRGRARTFENHVTIRVLDAQKRQVAETYATATGELGQMNPFTARVMLTRSPGTEITIELLDFSAKDGSVRERVSRTVPYAAPDTRMQLYFSAAGSSTDCTKVVAVARAVPKTSSRIRATVEALLTGPTEAERARGLSAPFPTGVSIRGVNLKGTTAIVDFSDSMRSVGGSCRAQALRAMIEKSLRAIDGVNEVQIRAGGSEPALQP